MILRLWKFLLGRTDEWMAGSDLLTEGAGIGTVRPSVGSIDG